ncbi:hypothetical protein QMQ_3097 [Clostridioides difficile DA00306]|nr:hypothetical protein QMQ_3097 [Clostridioides difficile DA00306]
MYKYNNFIKNTKYNTNNFIKKIILPMYIFEKRLVQNYNLNFNKYIYN